MLNGGMDALVLAGSSQRVNETSLWVRSVVNGEQYRSDRRPTVQASLIS